MSIFHDEGEDSDKWERQFISGDFAKRSSLGEVTRYKPEEQMPSVGYVGTHIMESESVPCLVWVAGQEEPLVVIFWMRDDDRSGWHVIIRGEIVYRLDKNDIKYWAFLPYIR